MVGSEGVIVVIYIAVAVTVEVAVVMVVLIRGCRYASVCSNGIYYDKSSGYDIGIY